MCKNDREEFCTQETVRTFYPKVLPNEIPIKPADRNEILHGKFNENKNIKPPALFHRAENLKNPPVEDMSWAKVIESTKTLALRVIRYRLDSVFNYNSVSAVCVSFQFPMMIGNVPRDANGLDYSWIACAVKTVVESYGYKVEMNASKDFSDVTFRIMW